MVRVQQVEARPAPLVVILFLAQSHQPAGEAADRVPVQKTVQQGVVVAVGRVIAVLALLEPAGKAAQVPIIQEIKQAAAVAQEGLETRMAMVVQAPHHPYPAQV